MEPLFLFLRLSMRKLSEIVRPTKRQMERESVPEAKPQRGEPGCRTPVKHKFRQGVQRVLPLGEQNLLPFKGRGENSRSLQSIPHQV